MGDNSNNNSHNPAHVTVGLLVASVLIALAIGWGEYVVPNPSPSILPKCLDRWINFQTDLIFLTIFAVTIGAAFKWPQKNHWNTFAFLQITAYVFCWTGHRGGLSNSQYGAAYLSLFAVALIVPKNNRTKILASIFVGVGAWLLAWWSPDQAREVFICVSSMFGTFLGSLIRWFLIKEQPKT